MHLPSIIDGDDHISPFESKMWSLVFHCMMKYSCPIMFKHHRGYPDKKINACVEFFVPIIHPRAHEIVEFLAHELKDEEIESHLEIVHGEHEFYSPGRDIVIRYFNGVQLYCERDQWEEIAPKLLQYFMDSIKELKKS